jgi:hypothetical protein
VQALLITAGIVPVGAVDVTRAAAGAVYNPKMRFFVILLLLLSGCAEGARADRPDPPKGNPPKLAQDGPAPAWIETAAHVRWLAYGSYCWATLCVDMIPPAMRTDIPRVAVNRGDRVRIHLAFMPREASIVLIRAGKPKVTRIQPKRVLVWRPRNANGVVMVDVRGRQGSASYLFRLRASS